jgi:predicted DNA-binding transcriptional regulator YafY
MILAVFGAMRRQARLFAIAEYLRARRTGVTAGALAERFRVTVRTIYRDLDSLREADLPLHAEQGRGGGFALDRHYTLPPINLSAREAAVLLTVARHAGAMRLLPFAETLEAAADKVRGALSLSAQRELLRHLERLRFTGVPALSAPASVRAAVEDALFADAPLEVAFRRADGALSRRTVRLEQLVLERSLTLLNCVDVETQERRQYRLDRVEAARVRGPRAPHATPDD